jgi:uncharacterized protein (TIGR02266 family)
MTLPAGTVSKTIVLARNADVVRERFAAALLEAGHTPLGIDSAGELLARLRLDRPRVDLVVLDLRLRQAGGVELVRAVRELEGGGLPILVFSGTIASPEQVRTLASLGVSGYINEYSAAHQIVPALAPYLYPENFNRRGSPRVVLGIPVAYRSENTIASAVTLTLSRGGLAIRTMSPLERGSKLHGRFRLPGSERDVEASSRVAWSDRRIGMGLQFEKVDAADQAAIDRFVDQHSLERRNT